MHYKARIQAVLATVAVAALAGCTPVDRGFGEAIKYDMAIQTINPDPVYSADGAQPGDNGARAAEAMKRYRTGNVTPVETIETTSSTSAGGGPQ